LTVATAVLDEDQVPPVVASARVVVDPAQTVVVPVINATVGLAFTVTVVARLGADVQPLALVMVTV
jgi:hypothetical protein